MKQRRMASSNIGYVGLQPGAGLVTPPRPSGVHWSTIQAALAWMVLLIIYWKVSRVLALLLLLSGGIVYYFYVLPSRRIQQRIEARMERLARMERINREREESEAMVEEAAILMLEINRQHLQEFLQTNPQATYEEWIQDLHPDNVYEEGIDHRFYVHDSDHRLLWNELLDGDRTYVAAKNNSNSNSNMDE